MRNPAVAANLTQGVQQLISAFAHMQNRWQLMLLGEFELRSVKLRLLLAHLKCAQRRNEKIQTNFAKSHQARVISVQR